jgi:hypothetical protein
MSDAIATYSFLPWLRQGIANQTKAGASDGGRAVFTVKLTLYGVGVAGAADQDVPVARDVALYGPGDITGIDARAVFRTEPKHWTTNFESNYFAAIDFYDEDMPWRYTPDVPDAHGRLQPWLALVVLEEGAEFSEAKDVRDRPLPYVEITDVTLLPPPEQLWAWAHVHVNRSLAANDAELVSTDVAAIISRFQTVLGENADLAYSRVLSSRKLEPNKGYHAFLIPSFESGRRAGLGIDPFANPAVPAVTTSAWADYAGRPEGTKYPVYQRWYFRTGGEGDFESLVRLLQPQQPDHRVGRRDIDVQDPGLEVRGVQVGRPDLAGVLKLGGALKVPDEDFTDPKELAEVQKYEAWATPYPQPIQQDLATVVNLADDYAAIAADQANKNAGIVDPNDPNAGDPDPVITPPLYGTWHAMTKRLLVDRDGSDLPNRANWVHELNLDPRFRVAAGLGTRVVQDQQENYMNAAWEQIGRVLDANRRIRLGHLALAASTMWYERQLAPLAATNRQKALTVFAPLNKRLVLDGATIHQQLLDSPLQPAITSPALRRITRPRARLMQRLPFSSTRPATSLLDRVNEGAVSVAPPRAAPPGAQKIQDVAKAVGTPIATDNLTPPLSTIIDAESPSASVFLPFLIALLLTVLAFLAAPLLAIPVAAALFAAAFFVYRRLRKTDAARRLVVRAAAAVSAVAPPPATIDAIPKSPDFRITDPGSNFLPTRGATDSVEAARFKDGLKQLSTLLSASSKAAEVPPKRPLDLARVNTQFVTSLVPSSTISKRVMGTVVLPPRIVAEIGDAFVEAMAYPEIDLPMYEPLKNLGAELLIPNVNFIPANSVTLLETNQKFIEAYMMGLNHEFARELLWREYPTDQRGSYFRQFWDVSNCLGPGNLDADALKEKLRDITRLDHWLLTSKLGTHNNRTLTSGGQATVVLVIRGELLKRYPNAVIYAHRARWQVTNGHIDRSKERLLETLSAAEEAAPPASKVRTPLYDAKVDPDIYFFGFDLTVDEARGDHPKDDPGWFFVIKERPGEPRFGLDLDRASQLGSWNDLAWPDMDVAGKGPFLQVPGAKTFPFVEPDPGDPEHIQYLEDRRVTWDGDMSAADLAYILFQEPMLVAIHASELLPH